jgi:5-methylcytosine-specific restriction endonuclease McrA
MPAANTGRRGRPWRRIRQQVLDACNVCWLCGQPGADTVDHIIPLSVLKATGRMELAEDPGNLRSAHARCNSRRQAKPPTFTSPTPPSRRW